MKWHSFREVEKQAEEYFFSGKLKEFVEFYTQVLGHFPDNDHEILMDLVFVNLQMKNIEGALDFLEKGISMDNCFAIFPNDPNFEALKDMPRFQKIISENNRIKAALQKETKSQSVVILPVGYDPNKKYPLFITLHGWAKDNAIMQRFWQSESLSKQFIHVFLQSSQVVGTKSYSWDDQEKAKEDIRVMFYEISEKYAVDMDQVFIGGFSQGGWTALNAAFNQIIPLKGLITLCPAKHAEWKDFDLSIAKNSGLCCVILTGEEDGSLEGQKEIIADLDAAHIPHQFVITPALGHWFPENLSQQLDEAIKFIFSSEK
jgi:predicted esterase